MLPYTRPAAAAVRSRRAHVLATTFALAALPLAAATQAASVSFTGSYFQDFDGLNQTGSQTVSGRGPHSFSALTSLTVSDMDGWYFGNPGGSSGNTEFRAQDGSLSGSAGRGVVSFGTSGSSDRALGTLPTSNQVSAFGVLLTNTSGSTLAGITISFVGEQWRAGDADVLNTLSFHYGFGNDIYSATTPVAALAFNAPVLSGGESALNGNLLDNQQALSASILGLDWAPGQTLALLWQTNELSGQDNGLAIDNLSVTVVPLPAAAWMLLSALGPLAWSRRRARARPV